MLKYLLFFLLAAFCMNAQNKWSTKFEESDFLSTADYNETIIYFKAIAEYSDYARLKTFGISPQGRELKYLIVSKDKIFDPESGKRSGKAIILINNGIHAGEIEGKDASMLMLREMLVTKENENLLDNLILLIIPIFNVDGHERKSPYNRINQNGPSEMGWRTTAQNLNLNRDFIKADAPEMKAFLRFFNKWQPDIFIDNHTTNGADYQYTITYDISKSLNIPPVTRNLVINEIIPAIDKGVEESGYLISPFVGFVDGNYNNGIRDWIATPRFSNGYAAVQNKIGLLVETHMLKPYKDRVFSTKALLESVIEYSSANYQKLKNASKKAEQFVIETYGASKNAFPVKFKIIDDGDKFNFKGFERVERKGDISGSEIERYSNNKTEISVPYFNKDVVIDSVYLPEAYLIPKEWKHLLEIAELHGIEYSKIENRMKLEIEKIKFKNVKLADRSYEGRQIPDFDFETYRDTVFADSGDYLINSDQRTIGIIAHLFEPKFSDSFVKWGFMNIIFERKEYFEAYSMEPIAEKMMAENDRLREEFNDRIKSDSSFANNPWERLNFFYERSDYYDKKHNLYPILRVIRFIDKK